MDRANGSVRPGRPSRGCLDRRAPLGQKHSTVDSALPKGWSPCDIDTETMMLNTNVRRKIEVIPIHQVSEDSCKERTVPLVGWRENVRDLMECKHSHRRSPLV